MYTVAFPRWKRNICVRGPPMGAALSFGRLRAARVDGKPEIEAHSLTWLNTQRYPSPADSRPWSMFARLVETSLP